MARVRATFSAAVDEASLPSLLAAARTACAGEAQLLLRERVYREPAFAEARARAEAKKLEIPAKLLLKEAMLKEAEELQKGQQHKAADSRRKAKEAEKRKAPLQNINDSAFLLADFKETAGNCKSELMSKSVPYRSEGKRSSKIS